MPIHTLSILALVAAFLHIRAEYCGPRWQVYLFKPLTVIFIFLIAVFTPGVMPLGYRYAIWIGLAFSLVGDIFLMLPGHHFVKGLAAFLIAHVCYIGAFYLPLQQVEITKAVLIFIGVGLLLGRLIAPGLGKLKIPVVMYMLVIMTMGWQAYTLWRLSPLPQASLAFSGALLFILSDALLAINRFRRKFQLAQACILSTYYLAQWLITRSI